MKKGRLAAVMLLCFMFVGCAKDMRMTDDGSDTDEMKIGFFVKYSLVGMSVKSPEADGPVAEDAIEDMNLYLVNELGDVVAHLYLSGNDGTDAGEDLADEKFKMGASIRKGEMYSVYAVANAGCRMPVCSLEELQSLEYVFESDKENVRSSVLMAGNTAPQMLYDGAIVLINIERCISRIILKADYEGLNDNVEIDVKSISLKNIPDRVRLFGPGRIEDPVWSMDGESVIDISRESLQEGIVFYQYENMQGTLQPDNVDCTKKVWPLESIYSRICSYVELEATYSSPRKRGDILYRFYLGADMTTNYDVVRNTSQTVTVSFIGDGGVDENTWRVDRSEVDNLVTSVAVNPSGHRFIEYGATLQLDVEVLPEDAADKNLSFRSTDHSVATVDGSGNVTSVGEGECLVIAESCDGTGLSDTCSIIVANPNIAFAEKGRVMFDGETARVDYDLLSPAGIDVELLLSNENAQITSSDSEGFTVKALTPGICAITARVGSAKAVYELDIRKLSISVKDKSDTVYNHFYYDFEYIITPEHAADMGVKVIADSRVSDHIEMCGGNRILVSVDKTLEYPDEIYDFTLEIDGRSDVYDDVQLKVEESSLADIRMVPNLNNKSKSAGLDFATSPRAFASLRCQSALSGVDFVLDMENPTVTLATPCRLNGSYGLRFVADGDDGEKVFIDAGLEVYEAVYVIASSKLVSNEIVSQRPLVYEYVNEVELNLMSWPDSFLFAEGELTGTGIPDFEYMLDGKVYSDMVPDVYYTHRFTFRNNEEYPQFPSGTWAYDGREAPEKYMEFYSIEILQPWIVLPGNKFIYLSNRVFAGGFCDEGTGWDEIMDIVYKK